MKLLILTQYYPPEMGAPQSRLSELATGLRNLGWQISVVTAMPNYPKGKIFAEYTGKFTANETYEDISVKRYWLYPSNSTRAMPRIISMLSFSITVLFSVFYTRKFRPDYIFVESPPLTLGFSGWLLSKLSGSKLIFNISDLYPLSAKELGVISEGFLYSCIELLESFLYKKAVACSGQSQEIIDYIATKGAKKVLLFRNGVDSKRFNDNLPKDNNNDNKLIYAGLLGVAQGILGICQNVRFKDLGIEFHIYGAGSEKETIEKFVLQNPDSNVFLHPVIKKQEIPALLQSFAGAVIPLKKGIYGAVPSKIYEAMAAGLPILFSGEGEGSKIIKKYEVGWVSSAGDYQQLENNIDDFVSNSEKRVIYSNNGKNCAYQFFDRKIQIQRLHEFLQSNISTPTEKIELTNRQFRE